MNNIRDTSQLDEPFDHDTIMRHGRSASSANLLQSESSSRPSESEPYNGSEGFHDHHLQDIENPYDKPEPDYSYDATGRRKTQDFRELGSHMSRPCSSAVRMTPVQSMRTTTCMMKLGHIQFARRPLLCLVSLEQWGIEITCNNV